MCLIAPVWMMTWMPYAGPHPPQPAWRTTPARVANTGVGVRAR
jgi:hypothetical protein